MILVMQKVSFFVVMVILFLIKLNIAEAQSQNNIQKDTTNVWALSDDFLQKIPSLEILIDSAIARSPELKVQNWIVKRSELEITKAKRIWTQDIVVGNAGINYGRFDNLIISKDLGVDVLNTSASEQMRYSVGLTVKIPVTPFLDRTDIKIAKNDLDQMKTEKQILVKSIREDVYNLYNKLIECYQKYKILAGDFETYSIIMQQTEKNFSQNQNNIVDVLNSKMSNSKAMLELITAKNNFEKAIWDIQESTGIRIQF